MTPLSQRLAFSSRASGFMCFLEFRRATSAGATFTATGARPMTIDEARCFPRVRVGRAVMWRH